jgi:hypothetical protein
MEEDVRVACGAYSGVQPLEQGEQEDVEEWNARRVPFLE